MNLSLGSFIQHQTGNITVTKSDLVERKGMFIIISFVFGSLAIILSASSSNIEHKYL